MSTQRVIVNMVAVTCCNEGCGVTFGMPKGLVRALKRSHEWFYCPHGHHQHWPQETEEEKLRDQLAKERHCCEQKGAEVSDLRSQLASVDWPRREAMKVARNLAPARRTVFWKGFEAREDGVALEDCPYSRAGGWYGTWRRGWRRPGDDR